MCIELWALDGKAYAGNQKGCGSPHPGLGLGEGSQTWRSNAKGCGRKGGPGEVRTLGQLAALCSWGSVRLLPGHCLLSLTDVEEKAS